MTSQLSGPPEEFLVRFAESQPHHRKERLEQTIDLGNRH